VGSTADAVSDGEEEAPLEGVAGEAVIPAPRFFSGHESWQVPGGWIVFNSTELSLDAHCSHPEHRCTRNPCRLNRSSEECRRGLNMARGRPLGLLMAWLAAGGRKSSMEKHKATLKPYERDEGDLEFFSLEKRTAGREWLKIQGHATLLAKERKRRTGEPEEPAGIA
jgi:hypothetical protein